MANHFIFGSLGWISHVKLYNIDMALEFKRAWPAHYMSDDPRGVSYRYEILGRDPISSWSKRPMWIGLGAFFKDGNCLRVIFSSKKWVARSKLSPEFNVCLEHTSLYADGRRTDGHGEARSCCVWNHQAVKKVQNYFRKWLLICIIWSLLVLVIWWKVHRIF